MREAYDAAREAGAVGPLLNPLFQKAVAVGRQVQRETSIGEGRFSVASVAVDYARQIFDGFRDKTVLCVGAGKMTRLVLKSFAELSPGKLVICNRDATKAAVLAAEHHGTPAALTDLDALLSSVDVVITSTGATEPLITAERFAPVHRRRRYRPLLIVDVAVPGTSTRPWDSSKTSTCTTWTICKNRWPIRASDGSRRSTPPGRSSPRPWKITSGRTAPANWGR